MLFSLIATVLDVTCDMVRAGIPNDPARRIRRMHLALNPRSTPDPCFASAELPWPEEKMNPGSYQWVQWGLYKWLEVYT